jgi:hypothetical protein
MVMQPELAKLTLFDPGLLPVALSLLGLDCSVHMG